MMVGAAHLTLRALGKNEWKRRAPLRHLSLVSPQDTGYKADHHIMQRPITAWARATWREVARLDYRALELRTHRIIGFSFSLAIMFQHQGTSFLISLSCVTLSPAYC